METMTKQEFSEAVAMLDALIANLERKFQGSHSAATQFVAVDRVVMLGAYCVGRMKSKTYAVRTANALNAYKPNPRGV